MGGNFGIAALLNPGASAPEDPEVGEIMQAIMAC